jgi:hypothetical protein
MPAVRGSVPPTFSPMAAMQAWRNGTGPSADAMRAMAGNIMHLLGAQGICLPGKTVLPSGTIRNTGSDLALWRQRYRSTPNGTTLISEAHLLPTDTGTSQPQWYVKLNGVAQATQSHNRFVASGKAGAYDDLFISRQEITITGSADQELELFTKNNCRVVGWFCWEKGRGGPAALDPAVDSYPSTSYILPLTGIYDVSVADFVAKAGYVWKYHRANHLNWNVDDPATPIAISSTTPTNIWESGGTVHPKCPTQYRDTYSSDLSASPGVATTAWTYASRTSVSGTMTVRFAGALGNTDIAITGAAAFVTGSGSILKSQAGHDTIEVKAFVSGAGVTGNVYAAGLYQAE